MQKLNVYLRLPIGLALIAAASAALAGQVQFTRFFAPEGGLVSQYEQPSREEICLNGSWQFQGDKDTSAPGDAIPQLGEWDKIAIKIPSPWNVNAYSMEGGMPGGDFRAFPSYPKEWESLRAAWMEKTVNVPKNWDGKRIILHFGAVGGKMVVFVNDKRIGEGFDIFFPQDYDVTDLVKLGGDNQISVKVVASQVFNQRRGIAGNREYQAGSFWGQFVSGIWQDVFLLAEPKVAVSDVFVQSWVDKDELKVEATVANHSSSAATVALSGVVREWVNQTGKSVLEAPEVKWELGEKDLMKLSANAIKLAPGETQTVTLSAKVGGNLKLWSPETPNLNGLLLTASVNGKKMDVKYQRFGWRQFTVAGNQFLLNGQPITLKGDSWHFMGVPQMTRRYAYAWYTLLKDAGANAVRLHASIYPPFYLDKADEMGVMILDESAIWASDGGPKGDSDVFWTNCRTHISELVQRDRNHPSVFGWSICNEVLPVLQNVWKTPQSLVDRYFDELTVWKNLCLTDDPTRQWISGDGEFDAHGRLPTINIHYGGNDEMRRAQESGKPWGVGETSMAYYGKPSQIAKLNGNRAYESPLGRMEGLAYECYGLLTSQQKYNANYQSVFNIAWYGVQPLPFGKPDLTHAPTLEEGIFFGKYVEGVPGMQPERIGPYCSTLNPGYDSTLPLYRPWPMFDAIRDANTGNTNSPWANPPGNHPSNPSVSTAAEGSAIVSYLPEDGTRLLQQFDKAGIKPAEYSADAKTDFLLIDGSIELNPIGVGSMKTAVDKVLDDGGTVWVWDIRPAGAAMVSKLVGQEVSVQPRVTSSFITKQSDPLITGLENAGLNFADADDAQQISYALDGEFVKGAQVVLEACPVDWRQWNRSEQVKTASIFRSEVEHPGPLAAVVIRQVGKGRVILCNMSPEIRSQKKSAIVQRLFKNEGVQIGQVTSESAFMDAGGHLIRALVCGSFSVTNMNDAYNGKGPSGEIREDGRMDGRRWTIHSTDSAGVFDLKNGMIRGDQENAYAYVAVWVKSSKPLNDLLAEPNLPKLAFTYGCDDGCEVFLNGELLTTQKREGPLQSDAFTENPMLLKIGWNLLVIKVVQNGGNWQFAGKFTCSEASFLNKLEFAAAKPPTGIN